MSDWGTMVAEIYDEIRRPSGEAATRVQRAICYAVGYNAKEHLWFNERRFDFLTEADKYRYAVGEGGGSTVSGVPRLHQLLGPLYLCASLDRTARRVMLDKPWPELEARLTADDWNESTISTGTPCLFSFYDGEFLLAPIPDDAHIIEGFGVEDFGTPTYKYDTALATWSFYEPGSQSVAMSSTYTSPWFDTTKGYSLTLHRACYELYSRFYKDDDEAAKSLAAWATALDDLRGKTSRASVAATIRTWI